MRPIPPPQQGTPTPTATPNRSQQRSRRRPDLTLPLPQRDPKQLAVPLPLPPSSAPSTSDHINNNNNDDNHTDNQNNQHPHHQQQQQRQQQLNFSEIERVNIIGRGSGGTVFKAIHRNSGKPFALKIIYGYHHEDSVRIQICREIEILRGVNHPNVVRCHDFHEHGGEIQVLLEFMDGGSLEGAHIAHEPHLADVARQILSGIAYLHRRKIVHRDIKPSNLLIDSKKNVKIADFGVSRILAQTMDPCNSSVGTIAYMSPERINTDLNHGQYDGYAGDIWSLGVSILEFYLGRFPFAVGRQGDWASLMCAISMSKPPEAPPTASMDFRDFIARCLQREPAKRLPAVQLLQHPFIVRNTAAAAEREGNQNLRQLLPPPRPLSS